MSGVPQIFDHKARALHRARAARLSGQSFLALEAAAGVIDRVSVVKRTFGNALEIGSLEVAFQAFKPLAKNWTRANFEKSELFEVAPASFDFAVSVLALHAINDLPGALIQIRRALKPDGLFVAALFGGETLYEMREAFAVGEEQIRGGASSRVSPFADIRDLGALLQRAGFSLPVADTERTIARYRDFKTLTRDLREAGETNALSSRPKQNLQRDTLAAALGQYSKSHSDPDGRLRATFDIVYLMGWAPYESG